MKKYIAIAALLAASFAVPTAVQADAAVAVGPSENCLVLPMLKRDCWEEARAAWKAGPPTLSVAAVELPAPPAPPAMLAPPPAPNLPAPPTCSRAPEGSKFLFVCE